MDIGRPHKEPHGCCRTLGTRGMLEKVPEHLPFGQLHHQREAGLRILLQSRRPDHSRMVDPQKYLVFLP